MDLFSAIVSLKISLNFPLSISSSISLIKVETVKLFLSIVLFVILHKSWKNSIPEQVSIIYEGISESLSLLFFPESFSWLILLFKVLFIYVASTTDVLLV